MEQSNSGMQGHGMPYETKANVKTTITKTKNKDVTAFKHSKVDELFNLVKDQSNGRIIICVGNNKVSKKSFNTWKAADEYIKQKPYEILVNVSILIQKLTENKKEQNAAKDAQNA